MRIELRAHQVAPVQGVWHKAYIPIRADHMAKVESILAASSEWLRSTLRVRNSADLRTQEPEYYDALPAHDPLLVIGHDTDWTFIGYDDIVAALRELSPHLADARFFMQEGECGWSDELHISGGHLDVARHAGSANEVFEQDADQLLAIALQRDDPQLESLIGKLYLEEAFDAVRKLLYYAKPDVRQDAESTARARIGDAASLAGCSGDALAVKAWLELARGAYDVAAADAAAALAQTDSPLAQFVTLVKTFALDRDVDCLPWAQTLAQRAPYMAEGLVVGLACEGGERWGELLRAKIFNMPPPLRERGWVYVFDPMRVWMVARTSTGELLDEALIRLAERSRREDLKEVAMLLFGWGEQLRIHISRPRARRMMDAALSLAPLGAEAMQRRGFIADQK